MSANRRLRQSISPLVFALVLVGATGCQTWHTHTGDIAAVVTPAPASLQPAADPVPGLAQTQTTTVARADTVRYLRVTTPVRGTFDLWNPRVANDSLYGQMIKGGTEYGIPVSDVTSFQTKGSGTAKTILLVSGSVVAASVLVLAVAQPCVTMC